MRRTPVRDYFLSVLETETDECLIWPFNILSSGYGQIHFDGRPWLVHRLALHLKQGPPPDPRMWACHGPCHTRACFNYRHVYWGTPKRNAADRLRDGTALIGEAHGMARLNDNIVRDLRNLRAKGRLDLLAAAEEYGATKEAISMAARGVTWKHVA